jgi:hypothetical protein
MLEGDGSTVAFFIAAKERPVAWGTTGLLWCPWFGWKW